jgi:hypothetical protein
MSDEVLQLVRAEIAKSVKENVNGKIDKLTIKLDTHITQHELDTQRLNERFDPESERYMLKDVLPVIEMYKSSRLLGQVVMWLGTIATAYLAIKKIILP